MPCYRPLRAYRAEGGSITFSLRKGWSDRPFSLPCGQCLGCRIERSRQWALRIVHEAKVVELEDFERSKRGESMRGNSFVTLTYDNEHVPKDGSLNISDWQLFAKRVRKKLGSFRYFQCGEYGDESLRPHHHACLFGVDFHGDRIPYKKGLFTSKLLEDLWGNGFCTIGSLTFQSAAYVARYVLKKITGDAALEHYSRFDSTTGECWSVRPEYVSMSRRPGIGSDWFDRFSGDVFPSDEVIHQGKRFKPPRYYLSKLPEDQQKAVSYARRRLVDEREQTAERLSVREEVAEAKQRVLKRGL